MEEAQPSMTYGELLRNANFRTIWFGQITSLLGDWFNFIASVSLIALLTGSGVAIGGLFFVRMIAPFLMSPISGVLADRYNRKYLLIASDLVRFVIVLGFFLVRTSEDVWLLYTLTALQLAVSNIFFNAKRAILPDVVPHRAIGIANVLASATWSVMLAFGAALGGLVAGTWGIYPAFAIDAVTFIISALFIARVKMRVHPGPHTKSQQPISGLQQFRDGLRYLRKHSDIMAIASHKAALYLFLTAGYEVIQVRIAETVFPIGIGGSLSLGLLYGMSGIGSGLGPIVARQITGDRLRAIRLAILVGYGLSILGLLVISPLNTFGMTLTGRLLHSLGTGIIWVFSTQLLLYLVPGHVRGRVFSFESALFTFSAAIVSLLVGNILDRVPDLTAIIRWTALLSTLPMLLWALWHRRGQFTSPSAQET